jgi:hypothetical protein
MITLLLIFQRLNFIWSSLRFSLYSAMPGAVNTKGGVHPARGTLFVMGPHSDDLDGLDVIQDLIDEAMLNVDSSGAGSGEITDRFLKGRRDLIGIKGKKVEQGVFQKLEWEG